MQAECYKQQNDERREKGEQNNYASTSEKAENSGAFVVQHEMASMTENVGMDKENVWYVDSSASNHMTRHSKWFQKLKTQKIPSYVLIMPLMLYNILVIFLYGKTGGKLNI